MHKRAYGPAFICGISFARIKWVHLPNEIENKLYFIGIGWIVRRQTSISCSTLIPCWFRHFMDTNSWNVYSNGNEHSVNFSFKAQLETYLIKYVSEMHSWIILIPVGWGKATKFGAWTSLNSKHHSLVFEFLEMFSNSCLRQRTNLGY